MRAVANKLYRTFSRGLITEASPLTYPENASYDEDNCVLYRKGNRSRRLGVDYEPDAILSNHSVDIDLIDNVALTEFVWESVADDAGRNFLCKQVGLTIYFYDLSSEVISEGLLAFTIDLTEYVVPGTIDAAQYPVSMDSGKGFLFIVGSKLDPILVKYNEDTENLSAVRINILIRDFEGVEDGLDNDEEPTILTKEHHYNLRNQGWVNPNESTTPPTHSNSLSPAYSLANLLSNTSSFWASIADSDITNLNAQGAGIIYNGTTAQRNTRRSDLIQAYYRRWNRYPGNNKQWWIAKANADGDGLEAGDFNPELLAKFFFGNTRAPRGHFILNAFKKDRSSVSGVAGLTIEQTSVRPASVCFYAGRAWYVARDTVYYSQVLDDERKAGFCYQEADPTSEDISDLVATDGGVIPIPDMANGIRLKAVGSGVIVFGTNGVWFIGSADSGFTATDVSVAKLSPIGTESPMSVVEADGQIFWWARTGIMAMTQKTGLFGPVEGSFDKVLISEQTIQTFFNEDINGASKVYCKGFYDPTTNKVQWLFKSTNNESPWLYDRILNFDLTLQAFYPWTVSSASGRPYITGGFVTPRLNRVLVEEDVVDNGDAVVDNTTETVFAEVPRNEIRLTSIQYICAVPVSGNYKFTFCGFISDTFTDWATFRNLQTGLGWTFLSYIETGYELLDDAMRKKQAPWVFTYFRRTEENFVATEDDGDYDVDKPSHCLFMTKWDWSTSQISNKWSTKVQAYRHRRVPLVDEGDLAFDTGFGVVVSKHKVRGNGKAIQFRFESEEAGHDFDLLGWAANFSGGTAV